MSRSVPASARSVSPAERGAWAWCLAGFMIGGPVLCAALWAFWSGQPDGLMLNGAHAPSDAVWQRHALVWDASRNLAQPWRLWGAAWVHLNSMHRAMNLVGLAVVLAFGWAARVPAHGAWAWLLAWPFTQGLLMAVPGLHFYAGLSGVLHAGVAVACLCLMRRPDRSWAETWIGAGVLLGMVAKIGLEQPWAVVARAEPAWNLAVVPAAHAAGCLAGLACAALLVRRH